MHGRLDHTIHKEHGHYGWDNSLAPLLSFYEGVLV